MSLRLSRARTGVVAMRQDSNYYEIGEKKGVKLLFLKIKKCNL